MNNNNNKQIYKNKINKKMMNYVNKLKIFKI